MPDPSTLLLERATAAVELAKTAGAAHVHASASQSTKVLYNLRDGILEKVQEDTSRSVSLSLYVEGRYSSHSTSDLRTASLRSFIDEAVAMTRVLAPDPDRLLPDSALYPTGDPPNLNLVDAGVPALDRDARMVHLKAMEAGLSGHEDVISWTAGIVNSEHFSAAVNTNGLSGTNHSTSAWSGASVTLQDPNGVRPKDGFWGGGHHLENMPAADEITRRSLVLARALVGSTKGPTAQTTMIVDPSSSGRLISSLLRPATARSIQKGRSFWTDTVGQKLFSDTLTITDVPLLPGGLSSRPYDNEGLASRTLPIVENGVVKDLYIDTYYGRKLDMAPTTGHLSNLQWGLGDRDLAAIIADVDDAIYVTSWLGGNADGTTGDFSFGLRGHRITKGELGPPISKMNVTGNLIDLFAALSEVGNDSWPYSSTYSPTLVFSGVQFSGA